MSTSFDIHNIPGVSWQYSTRKSFSYPQQSKTLLLCTIYAPTSPPMSIQVVFYRYRDRYAWSPRLYIFTFQIKKRCFEIFQLQDISLKASSLFNKKLKFDQNTDDEQTDHAVQSQTIVTDYLTSGQLLLFAIAGQSCLW